MYQKIRKSAIVQTKEEARIARQRELYISIFSDLVAMAKMVFPPDKLMNVDSHIKSIMYDLIELKTGKRPKKF